MTSVSKKHWIAVATLLAFSMWTANLTLYNWWAAAGPATPDPQQYETRGNIFAVVTLLFFSAAGAVALLNRRGTLRT